MLAYGSLDDGDNSRVLPAAFAMQLFHTFTLMHDDIMDDADMRRGEPSVHKKYGTNEAILSGDAALIQCYSILQHSYPENFGKLASIFNSMAIDVCHGQQWDVDFETRDDVSISDYMKMIEIKTAVLLAASAQMGALLAHADEKDQDHMYNYALNAGIAFQLQDDILDAFGDAATGKTIGGDIINNKKTYLYLKALELGSEDERSKLKTLFVNDHPDKINTVLTIYNNTHVRGFAEEVMHAYLDLSRSHVEQLSIDEKKKDMLTSLAMMFVKRKG